MAPTELQGLIDEAIDKAKEDIAKTLTTSINASLRSAFYAAHTGDLSGAATAVSTDERWAAFLSYLEDPNG